MRIENSRFVFSPSDLSAFLACPHLTTLSVAVARGELAKPFRTSAHAELIAAKGDLHEAAYLDDLRRAGPEVVEIGFGDLDWERAAAATRDALLDGADVVYQGVFSHDGWRGIADFLERQLDGSYEAVDTKLARSSKPAAVLQLTFYSQELGRILGEMPERMHVVLGTSLRETYRPADFLAYFRRVRGRLTDAVAIGRETYPYPVDHCRICDFLPLCGDRWRADDHLSRVAGIRRNQVVRLNGGGIATLEALGDAPAETIIDRLPHQTFATLNGQARLQLAARRTGEHIYELLPPSEENGFAHLPKPSPGDLFFDIEGDPWFEPARGLEYLFGFVDRSGAYTPIWALGYEEEKAAVERVIDLIRARLREYPDMHVYHYAAYDPSAVKRLVADYATREEELDDLLRKQVFVDLFTVVRQALRISYESYSIKRVREFFMTAEAELAGGDDATVLFERWLSDRNQEHLDAIAAYNEEDCVSTLRLVNWLLERKAEAEAEYGTTISWRSLPEVEERKEQEKARLEREQVRDDLLGHGQELTAYLLEYHRREAKPVWWAFFNRLQLTTEELLEDSESIGCLAWEGSEPEQVTKWSLGYRMRFPVQQHKLSAGTEVVDPATGKGAGAILELDDVAGTLLLKRPPAVAEVALPRALIPGGAYPTNEQRAALLRFAKAVLAGDARYAGLDMLLRREAPLGGASVQRNGLGELRQLVDELQGRYLFIQGPPGSGKTWTGARLITHLLRRGKRVGVTATSHKAIHKLLSEVEAAGLEEDLTFPGLKKANQGEPDTHFSGRFVENSCNGADFAECEQRLLAGTAWLFAREDMDQKVDYLFVDEAGQVSLADAIAVGTSAATLVLLGDPVQLAQVSQGVHPGGSGASVLEHLLGEDKTVREDMGVFLERTWRMHPKVCRFISDAFYEGRLDSAEGRERQDCCGGTGTRWLPVEHDGNRVSSDEEAEAIHTEIEQLLDCGWWVDCDGVRKKLLPGDVLVVAPYNAQVKLLTERLPRGVRVGTVDKFQGQQAPVVFYSMASSSGEDLPRGLDFLLSRNRLNVAVSRAQCLAYVVCSPTLLEVECKTIEQMRLANALCQFVEIASPVASMTRGDGMVIS